MSTIHMLWSWPFLVGLLAGVVGQRVVCHVHAWRMDQVRPLPSGRRRTPHGLGIDPVWIGGMIAVLTTVYVISTVGHTRDETLRVSARLSECSATFQRAISVRSRITAEDAQIATEQSDLRVALDAERQAWLSSLVDPPPAVASLPAADPGRAAWTDAATRVYFTRAAALSDQVADLNKRRHALIEQRAATPVPDETC